MVLFKTPLITLLLCVCLNNICGQEKQDVDKKVAENDALAGSYLQENGNENAAAKLYNESANLLYHTNRLEEAITYYKKVLDINIRTSNTRGQMITLNKMALIFMEAEKYSEAAEHLKKELTFRKQSGNKRDLISVYVNLAIAESELSAYTDANQHLEKAISLSKELNDIIILRNSYKVAYDISEKQGNAEKSKTYFEMYSVLDRKVKEQKMAEISDEANRKVNIAESEKALTQEKLLITNKELEQTVTTLHQVEEYTREQKMEIELHKAKINEQNALIEAERLRKNMWRIGFGISLLFAFILTYMIIKIVRANREIDSQRLKLEKQNKEIKASIRYAQTIQQAMLPSNSQIEKFFDPFILYMPKDIVSGDFYWISSRQEGDKNIVYIGIIDCTGHGVPGAFMSMIGNRLLSEIIADKKADSPGEVLGILNQNIRLALRQEETDNNDGMDVALCRFELSGNGNNKLSFAGAKRPIYILKNKENKLITHNGDRKSIGGYSLSKREISFTNFEEKLDKDDMIYLFSDGIIDQNGPDRKKFGRIRMEEAMIDCARLKSSEQKNIFEQRLRDYMMNEEQRDDISLIGLKII